MKNSVCWGLLTTQLILLQEERNLIAFDIDADVTATPNYDYEVADPRFGYNVNHFPPNVIPDSQVGNQFYYDYFTSVGMPSKPAHLEILAPTPIHSL